MFSTYKRGNCMIDNTIYQNPLNTRYASREMQENFGDEKRFRLW